MQKKITITLGADEKRLLENILTSPWVQLKTAEQAIVWSLGVANMFLEEYTRQNGPIVIPRASKKATGHGLAPEQAPSTKVGPFDVKGIEPAPAPQAAWSPRKGIKAEVMKDLAQKSDLKREG